MGNAAIAEDYERNFNNALYEYYPELIKINFYLCLNQSKVRTNSLMCNFANL